MASGVACLAHPACGASEVIKHQENGILESMETPDEIITAISALLEDSERISFLGIRARESAVAEFSLESMISGYASLYEEVAGVAG